MSDFKIGDIVIHKSKKVKCIIETYISNSLFEKTYTIKSCEPVDGRIRKYVVKRGNIELDKKWMRENNINILLDD
jgi:hypothetical protein